MQTATELTRAKADKAIPKLQYSIPRRSQATRMLDLAGGVVGSQEAVGQVWGPREIVGVGVVGAVGRCSRCGC